MSSRREKVFAQLSAGTLGWGSAFSDHMLVYKHNDSCWENGDIQAYAPISLDPAASIFHYGTSVFEGLKAYAGPTSDDAPRIFRPRAHLARLKRGCARLALPEPPESLLEKLCTLVRKDEEWIPALKDGSLYLRIAVVGLSSRIGVRRPQGALCFVICSPVGGYFSGSGKGLKLWAETQYFRAAKGGVGSVKAGSNYGPALVPAEKAIERGYDQILWLSDPVNLFCTESGMMNFMIVLKNGEIWTPPEDDLILPGITRRSAIDLLRKDGKEVREKQFSITNLCEMIEKGEICEMLGTGTGAIASPVSTIGFKNKDYTIVDLPSHESIASFIKRALAKVHASAKHPWMTSVGEA